LPEGGFEILERRGWCWPVWTLGLAEAPGNYERQRNEEIISIYVLKYQCASLDSPSPAVPQLL
jgi:hypothetical protein